MRKLLSICLGISLLVAFLCSGCINQRSQQTIEFSQTTLKGSHPDRFFEISCFPKEIKDLSEAGGRIIGAVVPHHLVAYELIGEVFGLLQKQEPSLVFIFGPNHFHRGERILTSTWSWQTPFGLVEADEEAIEKLFERTAIKEGNEVFSQEHSIGSLMAFVKYYLPKAKIVPIILHHDVSLEEVQALAKTIAAINEDSIYLASVDFSHYLTAEEAELKDRETKDMMQKKNLAGLFTLGDDYLDSPASLGMLFALMGEKGFDDFEVLKNTNSGYILGSGSIETTSYFTLIFRDEISRI